MGWIMTARRVSGRLVGALVVMLGLLWFAAACSSGSVGSTDGGSGEDPFAHELASLGDLAVSAGDPITATFDAAATTFAIGDDASLRVPEGAFSASTDVTVEVYELGFDRYLDGGPAGTMYVVSTAEDVELATPLMLEIEKPPDATNAMQFTDGEWQRVASPAGDTTVVPVEHFSKVATVIVDFLEARAAALSAETPESSDATFLLSCVYAVNGMFGGEIESGPGRTPTADDESQAAFAGNLAVSVCTRALIDRNTPGGERVSTACVGDNIDADTDLREAIEQCREADDEGAEVAAEPQDGEPQSGEPDAAAGGGDPSGSATVKGSASQGAIANGPSDSLITADFTATITESTVVMDVIVVTHYWVEGGPDENYPDQNCQITYEDALHYEGPAGNPTSLQSVVDSAEIVAVQGALCDDGDGDFYLREVGENGPGFSGQANGLGIDGTIGGALRPIDISAPAG